jgi:hypothetical protein
VVRMEWAFGSGCVMAAGVLGLASRMTGEGRAVSLDALSRNDDSRPGVMSMSHLCGIDRCVPRWNADFVSCEHSRLPTEGTGGVAEESSDPFVAGPAPKEVSPAASPRQAARRQGPARRQGL